MAFDPDDNYMPLPFYFEDGYDQDLLRPMIMSSLMATTNLSRIVNAHLIMEIALERKIYERLVRPEALQKASLSFHKLVCLFVALYDPGDALETRLFALNRIRNVLAHSKEPPLNEPAWNFLPSRPNKSWSDVDRVNAYVLHTLIGLGVIGHTRN
jgi:hypothetical protein